MPTHEERIAFKKKLVDEWQADDDRRNHSVFGTDGCRHLTNRPIKGKCLVCQARDLEWKHFKRRLWLRMIRLWRWI